MRHVPQTARQGCAGNITGAGHVVENLPDTPLPAALGEVARTPPVQQPRVLGDPQPSRPELTLSRQHHPVPLAVPIGLLARHRLRNPTRQFLRHRPATQPGVSLQDASDDAQCGLAAVRADVQIPPALQGGHGETVEIIWRAVQAGDELREHFKAGPAGPGRAVTGPAAGPGRERCSERPLHRPGHRQLGEVELLPVAGLVRDRDHEAVRGHRRIDTVVGRRQDGPASPPAHDAPRSTSMSWMPAVSRASRANTPFKSSISWPSSVVSAAARIDSSCR